MSRWLSSNARSKMRRMIDGIQERQQLLEAYPDDAHTKAAEEAINADIYADLLRSHLTDESIIGMLAPNLQYFSGAQISKMISYISGNESNLTAEDKQDLYAVFTGFDLGTTELEKLYVIDFLRRIFVDNKAYYFDLIEDDEDLTLDLELEPGDDWSGKIVTARLDSDNTLLSDGTIGEDYDTQPVQTVDLGDIDLPTNTLHKIVIALEGDNGAGMTNGQRERVVGHYYLFVQDLVTAGKPSATIFTTETAPYDSSPVAFTIQWDQAVTGFEVGDLSLGNATAGEFKKVDDDTFTVNIYPEGQGEVTIDIPAGVCTDVLGNTNNAAQQYAFTYDIVPTPVITSALDSPTDISPIPIQVDFGEPVSGFTEGDLQVAGGTISGFSDDGGGVYSFDIAPASLEEQITVDIPAGAATDSDGNSTNAAEQFSLLYDNDLPVATISSSEDSPTNQNPIPLTINWNEDVNGFAAADLQVAGATVQNFTQVTASQYTAELVPSGDGEITVDIPQGSVTDDGGSENEAAQQFAITYDGTAPVPAISSDTTSVTNADPIPVTIDFGEPVTGFLVSELSLTNCAAQNFTNVNGRVYTVELDPQNQGTVSMRVPGNVAQDAAGNPNSQSALFSRTFDSQSPAPVISSAATDPTATSPVPIAVDFGEFVSGFEEEDLQVSGGTVSNFVNVDGQNYTFDITPDSNFEQITVDIPGAIAIDDAGNPNTPANQFTITYDLAGPVPTISSAAGDPTATSPIPITISFNEDVTGFTVGDITAGNATLDNFTQVDPSTYTVEATPTGDPVEVTIDVAAAVCQDSLGNDNVEATQFSITYDASVPSVVISSSETSPTNANPIPITATFDEAVTGMTIDDFVVSGATKQNFVAVSSTVYTVELVPNSSEEDITVDIPGGAAQDGSGTGNAAATQFAITYDAVGDKPVITSSEDQYTQADPIPLTITFPEAQNGFTAGDITVGNGTVDTFVDQGGGVYTCNLNPTADGACTIDIPGGVCTDQAGNNNVAADQFVIFHDTAAPTVSNASLTVDPITTDGGTVNWTRATDAVSDQEDLVYELWSSLSDNITTIADAQANGTLEAEGTNVNNLSLSDKTEGDEVWVKVLCKDQAGNILGYTTTSFIVADGTPPTITSPGISTEEVGEHTFDMVYQEASDNVTAHANMKYHAYTSEEDNLNSVENAEANGTFQETVTGEIRITCDGLETDTLYYGQIVAEDEDGNKSIYDAVQQRTAKFGDAVLSQAQIFP